VEGKVCCYESKDMECTEIANIVRERERERERERVNCLMDKESPFCLMYKNSSFFAFETFFPGRKEGRKEGGMGEVKVRK